MRKIIKSFLLLTSILIVTLTLSCNKDTSNKDIKLDFKNKDLMKVFYGNEYYSLNGVKNKNYKLSKPMELINLYSKTKFFEDYRNVILLNSEICFELHDLNLVCSQKIKIRFNEYNNKKDFYFIPVFEKNNFEILKNRSSKIYYFENKEELFNSYVDKLNYKEININKKDIIFYKSSIENIKKLENFGLYPTDYSSIIAIHNPLSNLYSLLPNLNLFSTKKTEIFNQIIENLNLKKEVIENYKDFKIINDTILKSSLILKNVNFSIKKGVKVSMYNNSFIKVENSTINFNGQKENSIVFESNGRNSLYFSNCKEIKLKNVEFYGLSNMYNTELKLPSAITFYNSNVDISSCSFIENKIGDDYINFYNSKFKIENSFFNNVFADAIDSDFAYGEIKNVNFLNIGNDATDFSGSDCKLINNKFDSIKDKSISAGENSNLIVEKNEIINSEIGIVVKDGSSISSSNNIFKKNRIDFSVFMKKDFYKKPKLYSNELTNNTKYLFENGVEIITENLINLKYVKNVEALMYGNIYGKASK